MTTLTPTQPPVICYEIWERNDEIYGSIIDWKPYWKAKRDYPVHFDIAGRMAHFFIVTNDLSITRNEAIDFAKRLYEGRVRRLSVDLTPCNPKGTKNG